MKFGGTSMGSAERIRVAARLSAEQKRPVVVIVSAMAKITDLLLDSLRHAELGDRARLAANMHLLKDRHVEACRQLLQGAKQGDTLCEIELPISDFDRI